MKKEKGKECSVILNIRCSVQGSSCKTCTTKRQINLTPLLLVYFKRIIILIKLFADVSENSSGAVKSSPSPPFPPVKHDVAPLGGNINHSSGNPACLLHTLCFGCRPTPVRVRAHDAKEKTKKGPSGLKGPLQMFGSVLTQPPI